MSKNIQDLYVDVYKNLHKKCWSVRHKGRVIAHLDKIVIRNAEFVVQPAANKKLRENPKQNKIIHAFVRGYVAGENLARELDKYALMRVIYNPRRDLSFIKAGNGEKISSSELVSLDINKGVYAY